MKVLVIDVGGTHVKVEADGTQEVKIPSGPKMTARKMTDAVRAAVRGWDYDAVTIGYPGPVADNQPLREPVNMGGGWVNFDFAGIFGKPVKVINDAAMQALGSYEGGRMLFLGLGTGMGSALIIDGVIAPLELAHLPYRKATFEDYVGLRGLQAFGKRKWRRYVNDVVERLKDALVADYVVLGGGNVKKLKELPGNARLGDNRNAIIGGQRLWETHSSAKAVHVG